MSSVLIEASPFWLVQNFKLWYLHSALHPAVAILCQALRNLILSMSISKPRIFREFPYSLLLPTPPGSFSLAPYSTDSKPNSSKFTNLLILIYISIYSRQNILSYYFHLHWFNYKEFEHLCKFSVQLCLFVYKLLVFFYEEVGNFLQLIDLQELFAYQR